MTTSRAIWIFIIVVTALRLAMIGAIELSGDEAYYWMWSQHLAPGYFSKGPAVAFAIRASTAIFGLTEFGVRFWSPLLAAGTSFILFYFTRRLFNETVAFWTVIALNVTPIFNVGSFVMTIDPLSIFFWAAAMLTFWLALEKTPRFSAGTGRSPGCLSDSVFLANTLTRSSWSPLFWCSRLFRGCVVNSNVPDFIQRLGCSYSARFR